jgi:hypothetical protein
MFTYVKENPLIFVIIVIIVLLVIWYFMMYTSGFTQYIQTPSTINSIATRIDSAGGLPLDAINADKVGSYNDFIKAQALDPSVFESHKRWIQEVPTRTTVASTSTIQDMLNEPNPVMGLRRPQYRDSVARNQAESRVVSSEEPDQMPVKHDFVI